MRRTNNFDEAFWYFYFLQRRYPQMEGLQREVENYLIYNALFQKEKKQLHQALSSMEELYRLNPDRAVNGMNVIATELVNSYRSQGDMDSTKVLLRRLLRTYGEDKLPGLKGVRDELAQRATVKMREVQALLDANRDAIRKIIESAQQEFETANGP